VNQRVSGGGKEYRERLNLPSRLQPAHVLDKAGVDSAHIIGAKAGGAIAMQFAADYPARTRTLSVVQ
jgi:hypothetical protein